MVLLSVWSWEHFAIGRPVPDTTTVWDEEGDPERLPTWILRWYKINHEWGSAHSLYLSYTNEFDLLHYSMVISRTFLECIRGITICGRTK